MTLTAIALAIAAANPVVGAPATSQLGAEPDAKLGAASLSEGKGVEAMQVLESELDANPHDPAVLINLGIAHAHRGDDVKARALFKAALTTPEPIELETADGDLTDSRRLARKALRMLEAGDLRLSSRTALRQ
ncbi:tetratricopeptide repeat protein [Erythrobacter ani]|uniref:Tetratricopeptide repeat protein n=1 Tax=Erythrobacter ani TaxID=2827235 RepID=A0ABS6SN73_9SPHN|nr:tetratricopeptide repeat protein [Erythrobacter ani]MBV7266430.1 tetratricopeptide repeat protein [Erythrobacter ani]